jgi:hypothetical protein
MTGSDNNIILDGNLDCVSFYAPTSAGYLDQGSG